MNNTMKKVKVSDLKTAPWNPRDKFDEKLVEEIADDLKNGRPLIQAPGVWPAPEGGYYVIAGNTRMEAVRRAKLTFIDVIVWTCSQEEAMAITFKENELRSDVYPVQQAKLIGEIFASGKNVEEIVAETRLKKSSVYDYLSISRRVHPDILKVALEHPSHFTKSDLLELTDYPMESQAPYAEEWAEECGSADDDPEDNWRPSLWSLRNSTRSLKGCKFAGKGSKCATCTFNSANFSSLPGFEEEDDGERRCSNGKCYEETRKAWMKSVEDKKLSRYAEKVRLGYEWETHNYGDMVKKPDDAHPCCFFWWEGDNLKMLFGQSIAAKKAEEKAKKDAEKVAKSKAVADRENVEKAMVVIKDLWCVKDGYGEEYAASLKSLLCDYFGHIQGDLASSHAFMMDIADSLVNMFNYHPDAKLVLDIVKTLDVELPSEVMESVERLSKIP